MIIELGMDQLTLLSLAPIAAITIAKAKAIFERDNHTCLFPSEHECKGKLTIHHIAGKDDDPNNLVSVCRVAHWVYLHNGASEEQEIAWQTGLSDVAQERTKKAREGGWIFPF
jgi:hypothetical protein